MARPWTFVAMWFEQATGIGKCSPRKGMLFDTFVQFAVVLAIIGHIVQVHRQATKVILPFYEHRRDHDGVSC